jgi:hypothetical protein
VNALAGLAGPRPPYVAARVVDYDHPLMPEAERWLRQALPGSLLVFARGRYRDTDHWRRRWPQEREGFGGLVLATWSPLHAIGLGMARELADMRRLGRPIAWLRLAERNGALAAALVDCFRISASPAETFDDAGRIETTRRAESFSPTVAGRILDLGAGAELRTPEPPPPLRPLPGSRADFAARAGGLPIYVTGQFDLAQSALDDALEDLRREMPAAEIIPARGLYESVADWERRWPIERTLYGAAVVVTSGAAADLPDPISAGTLSKLPFRGGHEIRPEVATEIAAFVEMRRPVAWCGIEAPLPPYLVARRWFPRFALETRPPPGVWFHNDAGCFLWPATDAEEFVPVISGFQPLRRDPWARPKVVAPRGA